MSVELVAACKDHDAVIESLKHLLKSGISKEFITVLSKTKDDFELEKEDDDIAFWGKIGAGWGAIVGLLVGAAISFVPGFGPIIGAGPIVSALAGAAGGAAVAGSMSALVALLVDLGIEESEAIRYEKLLKQGYYLILIEGKAAFKAKELLEELNMCEIKSFSKN